MKVDELIYYDVKRVLYKKNDNETVKVIKYYKLSNIVI